MDDETYALIARLCLDDINDINASRKGKSREDAHPTDAQLALQHQAEIALGLLESTRDHRIAQSIDAALQTDNASINALTLLERMARDDREAALALNNGLPLPVRSDVQREWDNFTMPSTPVPSDSEESNEDSLAEDLPAVMSKMKEAMPTSGAAQKRQFAVPADSSHVGRTVICDTCLETFRSSSLFQAPCEHLYCRQCLRDLTEAAIRDEGLFPLRCCGQNFAVEQLLQHLPPQVATTFRTKSIEFNVPAGQRVYCPTPTCSMFLGSVSWARAQIACPKCQISVCSDCKDVAHPGEGCGENTSLLQLKALAKAEKWQTCPECDAIVELNHGCYHMTCRCRVEFCYLCARRWKNCTCPQWEERHLVYAAEERVAIQFGNVNVQPDLQAERVRRVVEVLRENHECYQHVWMYRPGGGRCSECWCHLNVFLLRCRDCQLLVCSRCSRNRLNRRI